MKLDVAALAIASFAGLGSAYNGMLKDCHGFNFISLNGAAGRAVMLQAICGANYMEMDINECFGWDPAGGNMIMPPASGFTNFVTNCSNAYSSDADFGNNFGCWGPWTGYSDDYYQFALNSYIGLDADGNLAC